MKKPRLAMALVAVVGAAVLTGCATTAPATGPRPAFQATASETPTVALDQALAESAAQIATSVRELRLVNSAAKLPDLTPNQVALMASQNARVPAGLEKVVSVAYDGSYDNLVFAVAKAAGWNYGIQGVQPPIMQIVHKSYNKVRAIDALKDLGYSITGATLVIDERSRSVVLRFDPFK